MDHDQQRKHVQAILAGGKCRAEAFHALGCELIACEITSSDYIEMADMLGFTIKKNEEWPVFQSMMKKCLRENRLGRPVPSIQKPTAQA